MERFNQQSAAPTPPPLGGWRSSPEAAMEDRILTIAAMAGALIGALAGTAIGVWADCDYAIACGTVGTLVGSGLFVALGLYGLLPLWSAWVHKRSEHHESCESPALCGSSATWDQPVAPETVIS